MAETHESSFEGAPDRRNGLIDRVKDSATAQLTTQKDRGTDALDRVANVVRSSTQKLRDEQHDMVASYVDQAANRIEQWSRTLRDRDVNELISDVQRLARRQPMVFIGSAFALGLMGARFLKSSRQENGYGDGDSDDALRFRYSGATRHPRGGARVGAGDRYRAASVADTAMSDDDSGGESVTNPTPARGEGGARATRARRSTARSEGS